MRRTLQGILCNALEKGKRGSFNFQSGIQPWLKSKLLKLKRNLRIDNIWCHSDATNCSGFVTSLAMCANKMIQFLYTWYQWKTLIKCIALKIPKQLNMPSEWGNKTSDLSTFAVKPRWTHTGYLHVTCTWMLCVHLCQHLMFTLNILAG